ncbi:MAG TPA: DEAD/DEAH box helicase family protein [Caldimonas sp.]|jgi:hypothetical protein|nr:DEAD/DEAH box helicase family protein [Caldimonas sp.]HEX2542483.1 DEAD/DEAH box helicase family protein [Caldimonas sp.]
MTSNFFLTRPVTLQSFALSAPVGSGKTRAAIEYIAKPHLKDQNFIYVAPTVDLIKQTAGDLRKKLAAAPGHEVRNVNLIHSTRDDEEARHGPVGVEALDRINEVDGHEGQVVIVTTKTFLTILSAIRSPGIWHVILDEAFSPATFQQFSLGYDIGDGWQYFTDVFDIDTEQGHRIVPREGKRDLVRDIAAGRVNRTGEKYTPLRPIAEQASNPALRCELVLTDKAKSLLGGSIPSVAGDKDNVLSFASYVAPEYFAGFFEVLFLSALFEQTVLYHLWTKALGVTFTRHQGFPEEFLRDTHGEQGRFIEVGHLLHEGDNASKHNLSRNIFTGEPEEGQKGVRVIDRLVADAALHFGANRFLLQVNKEYGYETGTPLFPQNAERIPTFAHGRNKWADYDNVAALAVTNPNPQQMEWVMSRTGMSASEVTHSYRIHTSYQAFGRCSIRNSVPTTSSKRCLTIGAADARFIAAQFPGSRWLGKVGSMPPLRELGGHDKAPSVTDETAQTIREYLNKLDHNVSTISIRSVKGVLQPDVLSGTWTRATTRACHRGSGWMKEGQRFIRVGAAYFGFESHQGDDDQTSPSHLTE